MKPDDDYFEILPPHLSDEAAVEILDLLQTFILNFETRYGAQIHRYYSDRSRENIIQHPPSVQIDDPPF